MPPMPRKRCVVHKSGAGGAVGIRSGAGAVEIAIFFRLVMPQMWRHALPGLGTSGWCC